MKAGKNKPSDIQREWHDRLNKAGYAITTCYNWMEAKFVIIGYLSGMEAF